MPIRINAKMEEFAMIAVGINGYQISILHIVNAQTLFSLGLVYF